MYIDLFRATVRKYINELLDVKTTAHNLFVKRHVLFRMELHESLL